MLEKILKNSKTKLGNYCILCTNQKKLEKIPTKVWFTLFKHRNTENSKTNESNKCIYQITDKINLKTPNKKKYWIS